MSRKAGKIAMLIKKMALIGNETRIEMETFRKRILSFKLQTFFILTS
jgi:hypothetical protein